MYVNEQEKENNVSLPKILSKLDDDRKQSKKRKELNDFFAGR